MVQKLFDHPAVESARVEFSKRLNYQMGLSRYTVAAELGRVTDISRDRISKYLRGVSIPRPEKLQALADVLNCTTEDLLPGGYRVDTVSARPGFMLSGLAGMPGHTHLVVNMTVPTAKALKIATMLSVKEDDDES